MGKLIQMVVVFFMMKVVLLEPVPDLVRVRNVKDAGDAEFVALDTIGLVEKWGYSADEHNVTSEDGYILNIFRILSSPNSSRKIEKNRVIYMQIGMLGTSDTLVYFGPNKSLAMQLHDAGYDVWMGNYRGSTYGKNHVKLPTDDSKFWDFSFHEIGLFDVRAMVDYILNTTNQDSLIYIGQSMATTAAFVLLSEKPEYNDKINLCIMLSPVSAMYNKINSRSFSANIVRIWQELLEPNDSIFELLPQSSVIAGLFKRICIPNNIIDYCLLISDLVVGEDHEQLDKEHLVDYLGYSPSGSSSKLWWHYRQLEQYQKFRQYDFENKEKNMQHYGKPVPPEYNVINIRTPMLFYYGLNDPLSMEVDVLEFVGRISSQVISEAIKWKKFNHLDFAIAKDVKRFVNDVIIQRLAQYRDKKIFHSNELENLNDTLNN